MGIWADPYFVSGCISGGRTVLASKLANMVRAQNIFKCNSVVKNN